MKATLLHEDHGLRIFSVVLSHRDEVITSLTAFATKHQLGGSHFTAVGAFERAVVAYFDWSSKSYIRIPIDEQVEVLTLAGDITIDDEWPKVHAHVVVGKRDGTAHGGHLMEGHVRPTLEMVVTEVPQHLYRRHDPESGLALIDPSRPAPMPRQGEANR